MSGSPIEELSVPGAVRWITRTLEGEGFETWAVGGAIRDALAGRPSGDWDLATRATPAQVRRVFRRTVPIGVDHGTMGVLARDGTLFEVTTFRRDVETTGRHAVVEFADRLDEDLARRDFTINAVAWHPIRQVLHDPFGGSADLERRLLRTVGSPKDRFAEDYLRILRALRFAGVFQLRIQAETWRALAAAMHRVRALSPERVREELEKVLEGPTPPSRVLGLYAASGLLATLYPELERTIEARRVPEGGDWFSHELRTVDLLSPARPELRWAALLHGLGEPGPGPDDPDGIDGADTSVRALLRSAAVLERLRASNARIDRVSQLVQWAARPPDTGGTDAELRRWLAAAGRERLPAFLRIWSAAVRADEARGGPWGREAFLRLARRLRGLVRARVPLDVADLRFSGRDLIGMGYRPGPVFGEVLRALLEEVLDDPERNDPHYLRERASQWLEERKSDV